MAFTMNTLKYKRDFWKDTMKKYGILVLLNLLFSNVVCAQFDIVKSEMTGAWYNPQRSGEGILIEILDNDRALVTWYTYDQMGQQIWMLGVGDIEDNAISPMSMTITHGAQFGDNFLASDVVSETWGTLRLEFFDCNTAKLIYNSTMGFGNGEIDMTRLTSIQNHSCDQNRNFFMGFTSFPPEASTQGVDTAYQIINDHADIVAQHFDDGIPWPEMLNNPSFDALPDAIKADWNAKKSKTKTNKKLYLAITPIAISRDQLAPYKGETPDTPLSEIGEPWASAAFDHPDVIQAYKNYAQVAIEFFHPDYLAIGIEVNLLASNTPEKWQSYVNLNKQTYLYLHDLYPSLPIFDSFFANDLYPGITEADHADQIARFKQIEPYTDYFALSVYPYMSALLTYDIPTDYFKVLDAISTKPLAIAESGQMAKSITLDFGGGNVLNFDGSEQKQKDWVEFLLQQAEQRNFRFVINFINQDYDILCQQVGCSDADKLWINTGLFDENHNPRPALGAWDDYLQREIKK